MIRPVLITIRGNSASGKSTIAAGIRNAYGRGVAIVGQDLLRREVLREPPVAGGANIALIDLVARHALDHGFHTLVEGILEASVYGPMLTTLVTDHRAAGGQAVTYYLDVPLAETLERHTHKPIAAEVSVAQVRRWYLPHDTIPGLGEIVLDATTTLPEAVRRIVDDTGLLGSPLRSRHLTWDDAATVNRWR